MKRIISLLTAVVLTLALLVACAKPAAPLTASELLDLGEKYLLELDYEQAIVQFLKVIEVEPMNARGYTGAAEAYIALGDTESAIDILQRGFAATGDDALQSRAEELAGAALANGYYIWETSEWARYRFYYENGLVTSMGAFDVVIGTTYTSYPDEYVHETMFDTVMAQISSFSEDEGWGEWEPTSHYWAGLSCTDCGEFPEDGSTPDWFRYGFSHAWSGEWKDGERQPLTADAAAGFFIRDTNQESMLP